MTYYVYILQSYKNGRFYIGYTSEDPEKRLKQHNEGHFGKHKYTYRDRPWTIFYLITCTSLQQAKAIEKHIKKKMNEAEPKIRQQNIGALFNILLPDTCYSFF